MSNPTDARPRRKALGQGLNALLGSRPAAAPAGPSPSGPAAAAPAAASPGAGLRRVPIEAVGPNPEQPRRQFTAESLEELAASIRAHGLLQPILVTPVKGAADRYQLVAGERRWRAAQLAGLDFIPALVQEADRHESLELALVENLQREDLNPIEAAAAFDRLAGDFGLTHEEIAARTGKDRATITNYLRLLKLAPEVQQLVAEAKLSMGHAKALLSLAGAEEQRRTAAEIAAGGLSVRAAERLVGKLTSEQAAGRQRKQKQLDVNIRSALADLERLLGTRVRLTGGGKKGALIIEYYSPQDLMRIYDALVSQDEIDA